MAHRHTTIRDGKKLVWYSETLWRLAAKLKPFELDLGDVRELDVNCWFDNEEPTLREVAKHAARIEQANLRHPIILNDDGSLMDGGHRLCRALLDGKRTIQAVRFEVMPRPDEIFDVDGDDEPNADG